MGASSLHHVGNLRDQTEVVRLRDKFVYLLSHLYQPMTNFIYKAVNCLKTIMDYNQICPAIKLSVL